MEKFQKLAQSKKIIHFSPCEIEEMKELVQHNKKLKFDENYHVLIIKSDGNEEAIRKMETTCFLSCRMDEPELLPQFLYVNEEDGSVKQLGICKNCARDLLQNYDDIRFIYNPVKHLIDQDH